MAKSEEEEEEEVTWAPSPGAPKYNSPPSEVRKFITDVLHIHHEMDLEEAEAIAAKWVHLRGCEFLKYDIPRMNSVLGDNYGGILRAHVGPVLYSSDYQKELEKSRVQSNIFLDVSPRLITGLGLFLFLFLLFKSK